MASYQTPELAPKGRVLPIAIFFALVFFCLPTLFYLLGRWDQRRQTATAERRIAFVVDSARAEARLWAKKRAADSTAAEAAWWKKYQAEQDSLQDAARAAYTYATQWRPPQFRELYRFEEYRARYVSSSSRGEGMAFFTIPRPMPIVQTLNGNFHLAGTLWPGTYVGIY